MHKKIVWGGSVYWNSVFQIGAKHFVKKFMDNGWQVAFLGHPLIPSNFLRLSNKEENLAQMRVWRTGGAYEFEKKLFYYTPLSLLPVRRKFFFSNRWMLKNWPLFTFPNLKWILKRNGFLDVDALVLDSPIHACLMNIVRPKCTIVRIVDNLSGFNHTSLDMIDLECEMSRKADCVVYTSNNLESHNSILGAKRKEYIPNGVNASHFSEANAEQPSEYKTIKRPIVVYVGAIDYWFDFETLREIAASLKDVSFVLIGPDKLARQHFLSEDNIHILGEKPYSRIPSFLHNADIGIIPFNALKYSSLVNNINPLKLYEYMACGLPVVASSWEELRLINSPAALCDSPKEYIFHIKKLLKDKADKYVLIDYAQQHDWNHAFASLEKVILDLSTIK